MINLLLAAVLAAGEVRYEKLALVGPPSPASLAELALLDLQQQPRRRWPGIRYLSRWPLDPSVVDDLESTLLFWTASLNNLRRNPPVARVAGGQLYRLYLPDFDWDFDAWEQLAKKDTYFAVTVIDGKEVRRGWIDPVVEDALRNATGSVKPVLRADFFVGRTSLDVQGKGHFQGFYSLFKKFPADEAGLFKRRGINVDFLNENLLLRGGAVLRSSVAQHNRELQLFPTVVGLDETFLWRSLDMLSNVGEESVLRNFLGTVKAKGREYIGTNENGTHYYYLTNEQKQQVDQVPAQIAQDRNHSLDAIVYSPYKCVSCHGPKGGIRHFDDVIKRMAEANGVGLAVIIKGRKLQDFPPETRTKQLLENYYLSDLGRAITRQQQSYTDVVLGINGLSCEENTRAYLRIVEGYIYGMVNKREAAAEIGVALDEVGYYLKNSGNPDALAILAGEEITREAFEAAYPELMQVRVYPWEERIPSVKVKTTAAPSHGVKT